MKAEGGAGSDCRLPLAAGAVTMGAEMSNLETPQ